MKRAFLTIAFLLCARVGFAQVTFDAGGPSTATLTGTDHTVSATVGNHPNRLMVVCPAYVDNSPATLAQTVKFNTGESLTRLGGDGQSTDIVQEEMWYIVNPSITTANIIVHYAGSETGSVGWAVFYNVDQVSPIRSNTSSNGTAQPSVSATIASVSGDMGIACVHAHVASVTQSGSEIEKWDVNTSSGSRTNGGEILAATTTTITMGFGFSSTGYGFVAADIAQAASGPSTGSLMMMGVGK